MCKCKTSIWCCSYSPQIFILGVLSFSPSMGKMSMVLNNQSYHFIWFMLWSWFRDKPKQKPRFKLSWALFLDLYHLHFSVIFIVTPWKYRSVLHTLLPAALYYFMETWNSKLHIPIVFCHNKFVCDSRNRVCVHVCVGGLEMEVALFQKAWKLFKISRMLKIYKIRGEERAVMFGSIHYCPKNMELSVFI